MGFAEPLALLFGALYGVLIAFYLWERWRRRVAVPSLLLWEAVRDDTLRARRLRPDLLFVLQVLLLGCLIAGLAQPYRRGTEGAAATARRILVIDTSASMQAQESGGTRFAQAQRDALARLRAFGGADEVMLISAGASPEVVVPFTRDRAAIEQALGALQPVDAGADHAVAHAFTESARQRSDLPTTVDVFTDIPRAQLPAALRERTTVYQVGESDDNLGVEGLQIYQGRFQDYRDARAYVRVENFAHREGHGVLTVRLEGEIVKRSGFTIPARDSKGFLFHEFPGPGRVTAQLEVRDALAVDNVAHGWIRPLHPLRVLFVSRPSPLVSELQDLAAAVPALRLRVTGPEEYREEQARQADIVIFHRLVPGALPATNALYVHPPPENALFPVEGDAVNVEVLDWDAQHAALQPLRPLASLPLQRVRIVTRPPWSRTLLWSRTPEREFALALAGQHDGHRVACITFDLEAERLLSSDSINLFLFFMNLLAWLAPEQADATVTTTGEVYPLGQLPGQPLRVRDPRGVTQTLPPTQQAIELPLAGEYRISFDGTSRTVLTNFFDPVESDIGRASKEPPVAVTQRAGAARSAPRAQPPPAGGYRPWLYACAAALFLLEWAAARWIRPGSTE